MVQIFMTAIAVIGLLHAFRIYSSVKDRNDGGERVRELAGQIRSASMTFLKRAASDLAVTAAIVFLILWGSLKFPTAIAYIAGVLGSLLACFAGLRAAAFVNGRTAQAASQNDGAAALSAAFGGAAIMGLCVGSFCLLGIGLLLFWYSGIATATAVLGFALGASTTALVTRLGGGIFAKASDIAADAGGSSRAEGVQNPGAIADSAGDCIGDVAGMGADLFESFAGAMISCMVIAMSLFLPDPAEKASMMMAPFVVGAMGLVASLVGIRAMDHLKDNVPSLAIKSSMAIAAAVFLILTFIYAVFFRPLSLWHWAAILLGSGGGLLLGLINEYYSSGKPAREIAEAAADGPAAGITTGFALGMRSTALPVFAIGLIALFSGWCGGMYAIALAAVAMLSTVAATMSVNAFGPIADNAAGLAEWAHLGADTRSITRRLDGVGNSAASMGKGFAAGAAALTALALFGAFIEAVKLKGAAVDFNISNPALQFGLFAGAALPALYAALTISAVRRTARRLVAEIARQYREIAGLADGSAGAQAESGRCAELASSSAMAEMRYAALVAIIAPLVIGFALGPEALTGCLLGAIVSGTVLAYFMVNSGGALDSARKNISLWQLDGPNGPKSDDAQSAVVIGDTVGDPLKDAAGPAINILMKLMAIVSVLVAPLL